MFKKIWNKPITWGDYMKLIGICVGIYSAIVGPFLLSVYDIPEKIKAKFKKEPDVETYED